jgi:hypothetical protein
MQYNLDPNSGHFVEMETEPESRPPLHQRLLQGVIGFLVEANDRPDRRRKGSWGLFEDGDGGLFGGDGE